MQQQMAHLLRFLSVDMIEKAQSGHPGMPLGMADVATVLWQHFLRFDPSHPNWPNRDRFILSNGHGSALLYSLLYATGYHDIDLEDLKKFRQLGSPTAGHPEFGLLQGIDYSTGPLGQGLGAGVGMALAERMMNARFGDDFINHKTYVFVGDGCLMEGISEEAIALAGHLKLNHLIVLWDNNRVTIDGETSVASSTDIHQRFKANGWCVEMCDGHDFASIERALRGAQNATQPVLIDCKTTIGFGATGKEGTPKCHGSPLGADIVEQMRQRLNWPYQPFEVPEDILKQWRSVGEKGKTTYQEWEQGVSQHPDSDKFYTFLSGKPSDTFMEKISELKTQMMQTDKPLAGRKYSQMVLECLSEYIPQLIGGSADLAAANYTKTPHSDVITSENYAGNYINYGVREHEMAAIMNGMAAYGGFIPYGGTFLSFVDYLKPTMRLGALMGLKTIYVLTHDSIGVGEDGPTHQPIEQLAGLRATPCVWTFRPADALETVECYENALTHSGPSVIALSRQPLPIIRMDAPTGLVAKGAYVFKETQHPRQVTLLATGSEVSLAVQAQEILQQQGIEVAVVSMPCWELFEQQSDEYKQQVLGQAPRLAIEAASSFGWHKWVGDNGKIISMDTFGASAPAAQLFEKFGFTPQHIVSEVLKLLH